MKKKITKLQVTSLALLLVAGSAQAVLVAYEDFNYGTGANLTTETNNNGTGWTDAWATTGVPGLTTSGTEKSLYFDQTPEVITDGSTHVWSESNKGNERDFTPPVDISPDTLYFTTLVRTYGGGAATADLRAEFYVGAGASSHMRANVGLSDGHLFADGNTSGYLQGTIASNVVAEATTYLLAMKRTSTAIYAALIEADGNSATLAVEPTWQVTNAVTTGVAFQSIRLLSNGDGGGAGIRIDELRIATDWTSAVSGMVYQDGFSVAYDNFDYEAGVAITNGNGGIGWDGAWIHSQAGTSPLLMSSITNSLWFGNSEPFSYDGTGHIQGTTQRTAKRNLAAAYSLDTSSLYFAVLIRPFANNTNNLARARFEMFTETNGTGVARFNVGIMDNDDADLLPNLYVQATGSSYPNATNSALFASNSIPETTHLLICKRSGSYIAASVYEGGSTNSLTEPGDDEWQVQELGTTGVSLKSLYVAVSSGIVRMDEISMGNTFAAAIGNISDVVVLPETDGLPASWVLENFGSVYAFNLAGGADGDPDDDALTTEEEYWADTMPTNGASLLAGIDILGTSSNTTFTYQNGGTNADVYVDYRLDLVSGGWAPVATNFAPVSTINEFVHGVSGSQGFFRTRAGRND